MDVAAWLRHLELARYEEAFRENDIDADILPDLTEADLEKLGVSLGHRKKLLKAIAKLRAPSSAAAAAAVPVSGIEDAAGRSRTAEAERRQLTVLFCDLVGSTELSARLDPEDMAAVMRGYQECCAQVIKRWDGHVAKFLGDGVLAYFGYPRADEDDAERAVRAGLELTFAVARLQAGHGTALAARVGIATGVVMVGELIGEGAAQEKAVVGETPNLAARLQARAEPGAVVVAATTRRLLGGLFELADLGPVRLKGFAEPLTAFRVVGEGGAEGRFEAMHTAGLTPLIGRTRELAVLLERWAWAKTGKGQVVLVSGEPGIGKSRLIAALRQELSGEPYLALSHFCSPRHTNSAFYPIITQLERAARLAPDDDPEAKLAKLEALLRQATDRPEETVRLIGGLLGIPIDPRYPAVTLSPQRQKQRTLEALIEQLAGLARDRPVLEHYEDVHWVDPSTLELLNLLVERVPALPVLVVLTHRPEFAPPWTGQPHVTALLLDRLGRSQGVAMVERVTGGKPLPPEVVEQIVTRTDGVPLFVEELTKTVLESGLLAEKDDRYELSGPLPPFAIPSTLRDSLMARLDRLAPVKEVAQTAAVIGGEFAHQLLAAVSPLSEDKLGEALDQLVASELIFRRGTPPATTYSFKHALVQDAAYQSLLKSRRRQLHARVAQMLEERFISYARAHPEVVAHHFAQAGLQASAMAYWQRAGEAASARSAQVEAVRHFKNALEQLEGVPGSAGHADKELELQIALGSALIAAKGFAAPETGHAYARARVLARQQGDSPRLFPVLYGQWVFHTVRAEVELANDLGEEMLRLAEQQTDRSEMLIGHRMVGYSALLLGRPAVARAHLEQAVALHDPERHRSLASLYAYEPRAAALAYLPVVHLLLGYPERAARLSDEALATARQSAHLVTLCFALHARCWFHQIAGDHRSLSLPASELIGLTGEHGFPYWLAYARVLQSWALIQNRPEQNGPMQMQQALAEYQATGARLYMPYFTALSAHAAAPGGEAAQQGLQRITDAIARVDETGERWFEAELNRLKGEVLLCLPSADRTEAAACFRRAIGTAQEQQARLWELRAATSLARLWAEQGERQKAQDLLAPVYGCFTEGFDTADRKEAKALLDELA